MYLLKKKSIQFCFCSALLVFASIQIAKGQSKTEKLNKLLEAYAETGGFNGSVLVAEKGQIIYKKGFGLANMEWSIPNQPNTKHRLGSITKQFTAMLIVQLAAEHQLKLDTPIISYLPDYPKKNGERITIHHLLTHSSGIPNYTNFSNFRDILHNPYRPEQLIQLFADSALEFNPGSRFEYSNSGYIVLGAIIEKLTGKSYEQVLQDKILKPLNMNNTGYDHSNLIIKNRASGYEHMGNSFQNSSYADMSIPFSAGALYSTVEDLYLWDRALYTEKLLPKKYLDQVFTAHISAGRASYGYGWMIGEWPVGNSKEKIPAISHGGGINGFNTLILRLPSEQSLIVLLNNTGGAPLNDLSVAINGILHDKAFNYPKRSIATDLITVLEKEGINKALAFYNQVKDSSAYRLDENEMNLAGYQLLQSKKTKEAAFVFKLNTAAFPRSFNTYDSYGEALLALGDTAGAKQNYLKSVQLNPGSASGIKVLNSLGVKTDTLIKKIPVEHLKLLEGMYAASHQPREWKIEIKLEKDQLWGNDKGYRYKLIPVGEDKFINPDDGASLVFNTKDLNAISFVLFEKIEFIKLKN